MTPEGGISTPRAQSQSEPPEYRVNGKGCRVCIVYPADPVGVIPGGIDTFIRGILRWAPADIAVRLVGITTDEEARPAGRWTTCSVGERSFEFYPVLGLKGAERQALVPVVIRFLFALLRPRLPVSADVLEFHRIEPAFAFLRDARPKSLVMHQNMNDLRNAGSDIRWRYFPQLYFKLERLALPRFSSIFCVREDAAEEYRESFPELRDRIRFTPTWVDTETFRMPSSEERRRNKALLAAELGFADDDFVLISVGRLDRQKNPLLLLEAFRRLHHNVPEARLLFVGDGVLRDQLAHRIGSHRLSERVRLLGLKPPVEISRLLQSVDAFVLSSAYEGMPISVLEALGSGLPVVSTDVGEVSRVVRPGINGELVTRQDAAALASAIAECRKNIERYTGCPCRDAVQEFTPQQVLKPIFENYRRLAAQAATVAK